MKDLINSFKTDYKLEEPWRPTKQSLTIVVPIVTRDTTKTRDYVVLDEVKDRVEITDSGSIDKANIKSNTDKTVFIRGGTMLKGATQERATQFGIVVAPQKPNQIIPIHCIHASKGIRAGVSFDSIGYVPHQVKSEMLYSRNQGATWAMASNYHTSMSMTTPSLASSTFASDDLVRTTESINKFREDLKEILKEIPDYINQVGTVIIDPDGVVGLEMYNHQDSWKAFSKSILRSYADALTKEDKTGIFRPDMTAVISTILNFLQQIQNATEEQVFNQNNAKTSIIKTEGYVGEYTTLNGNTIHFSITRHKERKPSTTPTIRPQRIIYNDIVDNDLTGNITWEHQKRDFYTRCETRPTTRNSIMEYLDQPQTWTYLKNKLPISTATLSAGLKDLQHVNILEKSKGENGITKYYLTGLGHELKRRKQK